MRAFELAATAHWMIQPQWLETILSIAARENPSPEAVAAQLGRPLDNTRRVTVRDGVAVLPVTGPIFRRAGFFSDISGATSVETLAKDLETALADPNVRAVLLEFDSPGGEANGIGELAAMIRAGSQRKPVWGYAGGLAASAAYWLAAACEEVVISPAAMVGSIGCVTTWRDTRERDEKAGIRTYEIVSSQSPGKRPDVATESGRAQIQTLVDQLADLFVAAVADYRGVTAETVLSDFGQGGIVIGQAAVDAGMVDRLGSFEQVLAELAARGKEQRPAGVRAETPPPGQETDSMTWREKFNAWLGGDAASDEPPPLPQGSAAPDPRVGQLETQLRELREQQAQEREQRFAAEANAFFAGLKDRVTPAIRDKGIAALTAALRADASAGNTAISDALKASYQAMPAHGLTQEQLAAYPEGALKLMPSAPPPSSEAGKPDQARIDALLSQTPAGQAALASRNGKGA